MLKTTSTIEKICQEAVEYLSRYIRLNRVILYGSYVSSGFRKDSDIDIAVISEDLEKMSVLKKIELFANVALAVDSRVEIKGFGKKEFLNPEKTSLLEVIKKEGKVIL